MICIAGKNNIAVDLLSHVMQLYPEEEIVVITNRNDYEKNGFQKSLKFWAALFNVREAGLKDIYDVEDLLFLSLEFDCLIKPKLFKSDRLFNIHFSLLPAYKGMYTSAWPILNNESYSGVTLHEIDSGIDTGDVIAQTRFELDEQETCRSLYLKYIKYGTELVIKQLPGLVSKKIKATPQSAAGASYYSRKSIDYSNLIVDVNKTAFEINCQFRAFHFREYQLPQFNGSDIDRTVVLETRSVHKPGTIVQEDEEGITLATVDYDIRLFKDYPNQLESLCKTNGA